MKLRNLALAAAAATLTVSPAVAQSTTAPASTEESQIGGDNAIFGLVVLVAAAVGIYLLADSDDQSISA